MGVPMMVKLRSRAPGRERWDVPRMLNHRMGGSDRYDREQ